MGMRVPRDSLLPDVSLMINDDDILRAAGRLEFAEGTYKERELSFFYEIFSAANSLKIRHTSDCFMQECKTRWCTCWSTSGSF